MKCLLNREDWNKSGIYVIKNTIDLRIYIGSTNRFRVRFRDHRKALRNGCHYCKHLQRFVNKYGIDSLRLKILEVVENAENLIERENHFIKLLRPVFNGMKTAQPMKGTPRTEKAKKRIKAGIIRSFKKGRVTWNKGKKMTNEYGKHISQGKKGFPAKNKRCVTLIKNKAIIGKWDSISEAAKHFGIAISTIANNLKGLSKQTKQGKWEYDV